MLNKNDEKGNTLKPITAITHYVRSPIYTLKSYLEMLFLEELGNLQNRQKDYIKTCLENVEKIEAIVERLIYVMEIDEDHCKIEEKSVDIVDITKSVVEESRFLAKATNTKIFFKTEEQSIFLVIDVDKITEVLSLLIDNAIRDGREGEKTVEVSIKKKDSKVFFSIKDDGMGISEEEKEKIFDKFYRTRRAIELDPNSLGLDLYLAKKIVEKFSGKIWVEDNEKGGSVFQMVFPIHDKKVNSE